MVSCLMGDSTALASAIVRCCLKKNSGWNIAFQPLFKMWGTRGAGSQVNYTPKHIFASICIYAERFFL